MLETALIAFTTYFATIGPADVAALFAALTPKTRRRSGGRWQLRAR
jgi:multiple antibiotic resistance protein